MPCGHVVCTDDFQKLGGKFEEGYDTEDSESDASDAGIVDRTDIMGALEDNGIDTDNMRQMMSLMLGGGLEGDESESDDNEGANNLLPPMENDSSDDMSDSMPALVRRADEDSDDDSDVPPLIQRNVGDHSSDSDSAMPDLRARRDSSSDESSDNSSMPGLVTRNESDSSSSDSEDDLSMPGLVTRADSQSDNDYDMPELIQGRRAASGQNLGPQGSGDAGIYLMSSDEPTRITRVNATSQQLLQFSDIPRGTRLVPYTQGIILCRPRNRALNVSLHNPTGQTQYMEYSQVSTNSQIVSNGEDGIWTLGTFPNYDGKLLRYFCQSHPTGKSIRRVSTQSILLQGADTATWVHVKQGNHDIHAGLWRFKHDGQRCVARDGEISAEAKVVPDGHGSIWVVDKGGDGSTQIWLATRQGGPTAHHVLEIDIVKESRLIANIEDGLYIHTRHNGQWSLFSYRTDTGLTRITECPKDSKIVSDAKGNAWILQKDRSSSNRSLYHVRFPDGHLNVAARNLPPGTTMIGVI